MRAPLLFFLTAILFANPADLRAQSAPAISVEPEKHSQQYPNYVFNHGDRIVWDASESTDPDRGALTFRFVFDGVERQKGPVSTYEMTLHNTGPEHVTRQMFVQVIDPDDNKANYFASVRTLPGTDPTDPPPQIGLARYYFLTDHLGSVRVVFGEENILTQYHDFDPFGLPLPRRNSVSSNAIFAKTFAGLRELDQTGLFLSNNRLYDPEIGRWTGLDWYWSKRPHISPYTYSGNNPISNIDISGLDWFRHDSSGAVIWSPSSGRSIVVDGQTFRNIGTTFIQRAHGGTLIYGNSSDQVVFIEDDEAMITATRFSSQGREGQDGTISTYEFEDLSGFFLEPSGPSSGEEGSGRRIPPGAYELVEHNGTRYRDHYRLSRVPGRSAIIIHAGNQPTETTGCLLPGLRISGNGNSVLDSKRARDSIFDQIRNSNGRTFIYIKESRVTCD